MATIRKVILKLGYNCNNNCIICHASGNRNIPDLDTNSAKKKIRMVKESGASMVIFSGGEPTIRSDIIELAKYANYLGLNLGLATNGRMLSYPDFCENMKMTGLRYAYISLYGTRI